MTDETDDAFLGGRLRAWQPARGYRAGSDAVLLAAAVSARAGESVLELGCGTGIVLLCLAARVPGLSLTGVERNADYADLARRNCARNNVPAEIVDGDVAAMPATIRGRRFDHVVANPPYLDRRHGKAAADAARDAAIAAPALGDWTAAGWRRVRPGGTLTLIAAASRLPELLAPLGGRGVTIVPVAARAGREAERVLILARKGGRAPFRLCAPLVAHAGPAHIDDHEDDIEPQMRAILREGAPLRST